VGRQRESLQWIFYLNL